MLPLKKDLCSPFAGHSLQIILEHGEKLAGMVQLRDLQNLISQNRSVEIGSPRNGLEHQGAGSIWDLIQLVGEKARRNTVLLMDRDNGEVFYSKVSDIEEVFYCSDKQLEYLISTEHPLEIQMQRACEISNACVTVIRTAMQYRNEHQMWYPPPEGLTPWYSQPVVRNGLWSIASFFLQLLRETSGLDVSAKTYIYNHLEAPAEVLLEAYTGAITAKVERGEEHKGLVEEYWIRRDTLLESLYEQVKGFVEAGCQVKISLLEVSFFRLLSWMHMHFVDLCRKYMESLASQMRKSLGSTLQVCWLLQNDMRATKLCGQYVVTSMIQCYLEILWYGYGILLCQALHVLSFFFFFFKYP